MEFTKKNIRELFNKCIEGTHYEGKIKLKRVYNLERESAFIEIETKEEITFFSTIRGLFTFFDGRINSNKLNYTIEASDFYFWYDRYFKNN